MDRIKTEVERFHKCFSFATEKRIALYGAGEYTKRLISYGTLFNIVGLIDSDPKKIGMRIEDIPVISLDEAEKKADCIIINTGEQYWASIEHRLENCKVPVYLRNGEKINTLKGEKLFSLKPMYLKAKNKEDKIILDILKKRIPEKGLFSTWEDYGYCMFGPIIYSYCCWLYEQTKNEYDSVLFLARDGYFIQKSYQLFCNYYGLAVPKMHYVASGRRITYVAAIHDEDSFCNVLKDVYHGTFRALMKGRLDITVDEADENATKEVMMPRDIDKVMQWVIPYKEKIRKEIENEKKEYFNYLSGFLENNKKIAVVDIGETGRMIGALQKIMPDKEMKGFFFCVNYSPDNLFQKHASSCFQRPHIREWEKCNVRNCIRLVESFLTAPEGTAHKIENGIVVRYANKISFEPAQNAFAGIQKFILEMCEKNANRSYNSLFADDLFGYMFQNTGPIDELLETLEYEDLWSKSV